MLIKKYNSEDEWLEDRKCKITGTRLGDVVTLRGNGKKQAYWQLLAERLSLPADGGDPMQRGKELQQEAIDLFSKETGKTVDSNLVMWAREDDPNIAISPDGVIGKKEAVEIKCLASSRHLEALLTGKVPDDFRFQCLQYFIVSDSLETLYVGFYDPRLTVRKFFYFTIKRTEVEEDIKTYLDYQRKMLREIQDIVLKLSF